MTTEKTNDITDSEVFDYLVELRDSGETNMFGAVPYLQTKFGFDKYAAKDLLFKWMRSFDEDS